MGKSKSQTDSNEPEHIAQPLSSLKDPNSFGPPPKRSNFAGRSSSPTSLGAATPASYLRQETRQPEPAPEPEEPKPPPQPYRRDTTGLSTAHLPPPPARRDGADGRPPAPAPAPSRASKPKPSLPPRLPPRQTENPSEYTAPAPPTYHEATQEPPAHKGILNQSSIDRLGAAGLSIPGFGIGSSPSPPLPSKTSGTSTPQPPAKGNNQLSELQSRFARLGSSSPKEDGSSQGTTWAEKQAALKTASSFRNDPSSVSLSDARNAASTANNFRERHGAQVSSGLKSDNSLNTKYGLTDRASAAYGARNPQAEPEQDYSSGISMQDNTVLPVKKAPPPPPPKKKPGLGGNIENAGGPPPIPHASKPKLPVSSYH